MRQLFIAASVLALSVGGACAEKSVSDTEAATAEKSAEGGAHSSNASGGDEAGDALAAANAYLTQNKARDGVMVTESGLQYEVLGEGPADGVQPKASDIVEVNYKGTLTNGEVFDSSESSGGPIRFPLNRVIKGWTEGVQLMSEGDKFRFHVPPQLAYGKRGAGPIGPNEALIFDVELLAVVSPASNLRRAEAFLAENGAKEGVQTTQSGLQYEVVAEGPADGASPKATDTVVVHYTGTLLNGSTFDSSVQRGSPAEFPVNRVIPGWTEALQLMSEGDKFRLYIHPALAYGENPRPGGAIGPNDALIFDVELIEVK